MPVIRRSLQIVAFICTLLIGMTSMAVIVSQTAWFKEWLRTFIVRQAANYLNGELSIGRMNGNLFFGVELEDVGVTLEGQPVVEIEDVGIDYNAFTFFRGHVVVDDIRLNRPVLRLERTEEGWNVARLVKVRTPETPQRRRLPIDIAEIGIRGGTDPREGSNGWPSRREHTRADRAPRRIPWTHKQRERADGRHCARVAAHRAAALRRQCPVRQGHQDGGTGDVRKHVAADG